MSQDGAQFFTVNIQDGPSKEKYPDTCGLANSRRDLNPDTCGLGDFLIRKEKVAD